jgi:hypothetical protein
MKNRDELTNRLGGQMVADAMRGTKDKPAQIRLVFTAIALLAVIGEEGVQVIFRKNFGEKGLNPFRVVACSLFFGLVSFTAFMSVAETASHLFEGSPTTFILTGIFYLILALVTLIKGFRAMKEAENSSKPIDFAGESDLLSFLAEERGWWNQPRIQNLAEPGFILVLGFFLSAINLLWGIPLIYCAVSVWINKVVEMIFLDTTDQGQPKQPTQGRNFADVDS